MKIKLLLFFIISLGATISAQTYNTSVLYMNGQKYSNANTISFDLDKGVLSHTNGLDNYPIKFNRKESEKDYFVYYFDANVTPANLLENSPINRYGVRHFRLILDSDKNFLGFIEIKGDSENYSIIKYYP